MSSLLTNCLALHLLVTLTLAASFVPRSINKDDEDTFIQREKKDFFSSAQPVNNYLYRNLRSIDEPDPALRSFSTDDLNNLMRILSELQTNPNARMSPEEERMLQELLSSFALHEEGIQ